MGHEIAIIFGSASYEGWGFLAPYRQNATVFCADGGIHLAKKAGFTPHYYVGDGDSGGAPVTGVESVILEPEKNFTDLQAAYEKARNLGFQTMVLTACTGGRQDHHIANLQLLETAAARGVSAKIVDPWNEIFIIKNQRVEVECEGFRYFSILPIDPVLEGVTLQGAKYPLDHVTVHRGDSLTVSNEPLGNRVMVEIQKGSAWLVLSQRRVCADSP